MNIVEKKKLNCLGEQRRLMGGDRDKKKEEEVGSEERDLCSKYNIYI